MGKPRKKTSLDQVYKLANEGLLDEAEKLCKDLLKQDPNDYQLQLLLARILGDNKKKELAGKQFIKVTRAFPKNIEGFIHYADYLENQGDIEGAVRNYSKAKELGGKPSFFNFRIGRALLDHPKRDLQQAQYYLRQATATDDVLPEAFIALAETEPKNRQPIILKRGLKLFPKHQGIAEELATVYHRQKKFDLLHDLVKKVSSDIDSPSLVLLAATAYFEEGKYQAALDLIDQLELSTFSTHIQRNISSFKAILLYKTGLLDKAETLLKKTIESDLKNDLEDIGTLILIAVYAANQKPDLALQEIQDLPVEEPLIFTNLHFPLSGGIDIRKLLKEAFNVLATTEASRDQNEIIASLRSRLAISIYNEVELEHLFDNPNLKALESTTLELDQDVAFSLEFSPNDPDLNYIYGKILTLKGDRASALKHFLLAAFKGTRFEEELGLYSGFEAKKGLLKEYTDLIKIYAHESTDEHRKRFVEDSLSLIVDHYYQSKNYKEVAEVSSLFTIKEQSKANILFENAFACVDNGDKKKGKELYLHLLNEFPGHTSSLNNLALLYEEEGELELAFEALNKITKFDNEAISSNIERVKGIVEAKQDDIKKTAAARVLFIQESLQNKEFLAKLFALEDNDRVIYVRVKDFARMTLFSVTEVIDKVNEFIDERYLIDHTRDPDREQLVLKVNENLREELQTLLATIRNEEEERALGRDLSTKSLDKKFGFNPSLLNKLSVLKSQELRAILERDIREAAYGMGTRSPKTVLVLCGSVIEAILMDQLLPIRDQAINTAKEILRKEGRKFPHKFERLESWDLFLLLETAKKMRIVSVNLYHLGNGLRGFRNLIHPGVEKRKELEVSDEYAAIAWTVVKQLLAEVSAP